MAEVHIDDNFLKTISGTTGVNSTIQLTNEAFSLLQWAADEAKKGRVLMTTEADGSNPKKINIPSLENVKP